MTRLAVIDVAEGRQPYRTEDGAITAVFNGEIYNFAALRAELESRGHQFASAADGEVIVHLWEEEGPRALDRLDGMFAIAVHDRRADRVWLARDRIGIKPLFAAIGTRRIVFGHALKAGLLPVVSYLGPATAGILTVSLVIERIFFVPGAGSHFVNAALNRDYTLAMGVTILFTVLVYGMNTLVDLDYTFLDPRIKLEES